MNFIHRILSAMALLFALMLPFQSPAQTEAARLSELERRVAQLESRPQQLERHSSHAEAAGVAAYVCAAFCALWAQQTRRNAWLWFFLGLFFNVITLLVLLYKNSNEKQGVA